MRHNTTQDPKFNYLTLTNEKGKIILEGETHEGIEVGDEIVMEQLKTPIVVTQILERGDAKGFPKGNNLHYKVECE